MFVQLNCKVLVALMELKAGWSGFQPGPGWVPIQFAPQTGGQLCREQDGNKPWGEGAAFLWGVVQRSVSNLTKCVTVRYQELNWLMIRQVKICSESLAVVTLINVMES